MTLEKKLSKTEFDKHLDKWKSYCTSLEVKTKIAERKYQCVIDCEAYEEIIKLGLLALPHIRDNYDLAADLGLQIIKEHGFHYAVQKILGKEKFQIPNEIMENIDAIELYTIEWLAKYLNPPKTT